MTDKIELPVITIVYSPLPDLVGCVECVRCLNHLARKDSHYFVEERRFCSNDCLMHYYIEQELRSK